MSREVSMVDTATLERHRADVFHQPQGLQGTIVELQHSQISEQERDQRETFYSVRGRMFWLVHLHDESNFNATSFRLSYDTTNPIIFAGKSFYIMKWYGRSKQFIEKWKRSRAHVFFDYLGTIFYLATMLSCSEIVRPLAKGQYALAHLTQEEFLKSVGVQ